MFVFRAMLCRIAFLLPFALFVPSLTAQVPRQNEIRLDSSEAEQVLVIAAIRASGGTPSDADWQQLFQTEGYKRMAEAEAGADRKIDQEEFKAFVLSPWLSETASQLRRRLTLFKRLQLQPVVRRVSAYLPDGAVTDAKIFLVLTPALTRAMEEQSGNSAIFVSLDSAVTPLQFENSVARGLCLAGLASLRPVLDGRLEKLPANARTGAEWMSSFDEGVALLAGVGGPNLSPFATLGFEAREAWDRQILNFNADLRRLDGFLLEIVEGRLQSHDEIARRAAALKGEYDPWQTVGYTMCVEIEKAYGRKVLINSALDPRWLLAWHNRIAARQNAENPSGPKVELWSPELLYAVEVENRQKF